MSPDLTEPAETVIVCDVSAILTYAHRRRLTLTYCAAVGFAAAAVQAASLLV